jgi:hypothetical protein
MSVRNHACAELRDGSLFFHSPYGWQDALSSGIFYLKAPEVLNYAVGLRFCELYHLSRTGGPDDAYRGFRDAKLEGSVLGYSSAGNDQVERIQLELALWERYLPPEIPPLLHGLNRLGRDVVKNFFSRCGVEPGHIAKLTGGMETDDALQYCIFNNYDSCRSDVDGFTPHKDSGFVTIIYSTEPGLEALENGAWVPVDPIPGYLTVINGHSLEVLTARMPVAAAASYHRVRTIPHVTGRVNRTSFGVYIGPRFDQDIYQYDERGTLTRYQSFLSFQRQKAAEMGYEFHSALADEVAR